MKKPFNLYLKNQINTIQVKFNVNVKPDCTDTEALIKWYDDILENRPDLEDEYLDEIDYMFEDEAVKVNCPVYHCYEYAASFNAIIKIDLNNIELADKIKEQLIKYYPSKKDNAKSFDHYGVYADVNFIYDEEMNHIYLKMSDKYFNYFINSHEVIVRPFITDENGNEIYIDCSNKCIRLLNNNKC